MLPPGEALLLENLRFYPEEEGKPVGVEKGTPEFDEAKKEMKVRQKEFAKKLASYADVYVNDAFGTAHRKHASTAVIADYFDADSKMLGYLMEKEVTAIDNVLKNAQHPFTAIIGGSKVSSKLGVIKNLLDKVDNLIIGGGMGYTFIKAQRDESNNDVYLHFKLKNNTGMHLRNLKFENHYLGFTDNLGNSYYMEIGADTNYMSYKYTTDLEASAEMVFIVKAKDVAVQATRFSGHFDVSAENYVMDDNVLNFFNLGFALNN